MKQQTYSFSSASTTCYFDADLSLLDTITDPGTTIVVTDENVYRSHANHFQGRKTIVIKAGERFKTQDTVNEIIKQLISYKADRKFFIVGIGGGVVTDVTGYAASVY